MKKYSFLLIGLFFSLSTSLLAEECSPINFSCASGKHTVHLSFDDGPAPQTPFILDVLRRHDVRASFFILGEKLITSKDKKKNNKLARKYFATLEEMKRDGHVIASHTFYHLHHYDSAMNTERFPADAEYLDKNQMQWKDNFSIIKKSTVLRDYLNQDGKMYFRLPYGQGWYEAEKRHSPEGTVLAELLQPIEDAPTPYHIGWNIDSDDWRKQTDEQYMQSIKDQICNKHGGVILMHDHTVLTNKNLECLISKIKDAGHQFADKPDFKPNLKVGINGPKVVMAYQDIKKIALPPEENCEEQDSKVGDPVNTLDQLVEKIEQKVIEDQNEYTPSEQQKDEETMQSVLEELF